MTSEPGVGTTFRVYLPTLARQCAAADRVVESLQGGTERILLVDDEEGLVRAGKKMLETPVEMLDLDVLCPHCQAQFQLRRRDSVEFKRKKEQEAEIREFKAGKTWLNLAIVAVVLVVLFLGALIVWDVFGKA